MTDDAKDLGFWSVLININDECVYGPLVVGETQTKLRLTVLAAEKLDIYQSMCCESGSQTNVKLRRTICLA